MSRRQRHLIQLVAGALLAVSLLGIFALVAWSDQPRVRYASLKCIYRQIYTYKGPVDVVMIGTSRVKWGVDPKAVSAVYSNGATPPFTVLNLARSWRGTQQMFQEVKDVENERGIRKGIVIEYSREGDVIATSQRYYDYYIDHAALVPIGEFQGDPELKPREPAYLRARDLMELLQKRLDYALDRAISGKADGNLTVPVDQRPVATSDGCTGKDRPYKPAANAAWLKRVVPKGGTWRDRKPGAWPIGAINNDAQRATMQQMVAWAHARGLFIAFTLMPRIGDPRPSQAYFDKFERTFGAPLLFPTDDVLAEMYTTGGYSDPNHLQGQGRAVYSAWLARQLPS